MSGLVKEDSGEIGFVMSCLFNQAIDFAEMKEWCCAVVCTHDEYPDYIFDIIDFKGSIAHLFNIIGFTPHWPFSQSAEEALFGIAYKRGVDVYDCPISTKQASNRLASYPAIEHRFKEVFPFITY